MAADKVLGVHSPFPAACPPPRAALRGAGQAEAQAPCWQDGEELAPGHYGVAGDADALMSPLWPDQPLSLQCLGCGVPLIQTDFKS